MRELSLHDYIEHLRSIQSRLENFIREFERGNRDYIQDIALKLRILFIHKSVTKALFTTIQTLLGVQIRVWVRESRDEELKRKGLDHLIDQQSISCFNEVQFWLEKGDSKTEIIEAINRPKALVIGPYNYSVKKVIEIVADKLGGAHIDPILDKNSLAPQYNGVSFGGLNSSEYFILMTARVSVELIKSVLQFAKDRTETDFIIKN